MARSVLLPMTGGMAGSDHRVIVYCLVPRTADAKVVEAVRRHYEGADPRVEVVVERRIEQRRAPLAAGTKPAGTERRAGTDRRRYALPRTLPPLPPKLAGATGHVRWVQRLVPVGAAMERLETEAVVDAVRAGDAEAPTELYWRWYERVHSRLSVLLSDPQETDAGVGRAFGRVLDALEDPANASAPFETLLYAEVDAYATEALARRDGREPDLPASGLEVADPELDEPVAVVDHDPLWVTRARSERDQLLRTLGDELTALEHVGSTAIEGIAGRPVLDLLAGVAAMPPSQAVLAALAASGYEDCGDAGAPGRRYLRKRGRQRYDLHVVEYGGALWDDTLALRDHLRRHPVEAYRWGSVKADAARAAPASARRYADLRRLVLEDLLAAARRARAQTAQRAA